MSSDNSELILPAIASAAITAIIDNIFDVVFSKTERAESKALIRNEAEISKSLYEYLSRSYLKSVNINTIAFGNQKRELRDLYIPLALRCSHRNNHGLDIVGYPEGLFKHSNKILITDNAGMGKSTLIKFIQLSTIEEKKYIPVLIELRSLRAGESLLERIKLELLDNADAGEVGIIQQLIFSDQLLILLDGFDEIPMENRESVLASLGHFTERFSSVNIILTSRPETALSSLPQFLAYSIVPLTSDQAELLIRRYDKNGPLSKALIKALSSSSLDHAKDLLSNPLLVSLLYRAYSHKPTIPPKKHIFYRQVYDALYENHDLSKPGALIREKHSGLDVEDFHSILRVLGAITVKLGRVEYGRDELIQHITASANLTACISVKASDFLKDLISSVPLFIRDGEMYRWNHKSIQEYFAACYLCYDAKLECDSKILGMLNSPDFSRYYNVLDLIYDIDYVTFRRVVILPFLGDFLAYYETAYSEIDQSVIPLDLLNDRKEVGFVCRFALAKIKTPIKGKAHQENVNKTVKHGLSLILPAGSGTIADIVKPQGDSGYVYFVFQSFTKNVCIARILQGKRERFLVRKKTALSSLAINEQQAYVVDESSTSVLNSKDNFKSTTDLMDKSGFRVLRDEAILYIEKANADAALARQHATLI